VREEWFVVEQIVAILSSKNLYDEAIADHFEVSAGRLEEIEQAS
jgi:hypothetical protein